MIIQHESTDLPASNQKKPILPIRNPSIDKTIKRVSILGAKNTYLNLCQLLRVTYVRVYFKRHTNTDRNIQTIRKY